MSQVRVRDEPALAAGITLQASRHGSPSRRDVSPLQFSRTKKYTDSLVFGRIPDRQQFPSAPYFCHWRAAVFDKMPIRQYLDGERFDPETTRLLGIAFETAIQALHHWGVVDPPREAIARAIIGFAKAGERDPERLCDLALEACSKPIISDPSPLPPQASPPAQLDS
jgi:hypothetical protein